MRVPSIGLTRDERRIVNEGYRLAERMLRDYRDPPSPFAMLVAWACRVQQATFAACRVIVRG